MTDFHPHRNMTLSIDQTYYGFMPHPYFPDDEEVFSIEGGEALIYQVRDLATKRLYALKVSKPSYRGEHIARATAVLAKYKNIPGLSLGKRICFTKAKYPQLTTQYPDLEYAVLMPWLPGRTWAGFMIDGAVSSWYTRHQAYAYGLALSTAQVLWNLEAYHLAHTDIAGGNIMLSSDLKQVELLDIEGIYMHGAPTPKLRSQGSPGYQHRNPDNRGQWRPDGDRFAGAILLTEMLTWASPYVRALTPDNAESLFQAKELQGDKTKRWEAVRIALLDSCPAVLPLFVQAWESSDITQCPDFATWTWTLIHARTPYA